MSDEEDGREGDGREEDGAEQVPTGSRLDKTLESILLINKRRVFNIEKANVY